MPNLTFAENLPVPFTYDVSSPLLFPTIKSNIESFEDMNARLDEKLDGKLKQSWEGIIAGLEMNGRNDRRDVSPLYNFS
jgi:hypothetical protein